MRAYDQIVHQMSHRVHFLATQQQNTNYRHTKQKHKLLTYEKTVYKKRSVNCKQALTVQVQCKDVLMRKPCTNDPAQYYDSTQSASHALLSISQYYFLALFGCVALLWGPPGSRGRTA